MNSKRIISFIKTKINTISKNIAYRYKTYTLKSTKGFERNERKSNKDFSCSLDIGGFKRG